jgi:hypothetical protein
MAFCKTEHSSLAQEGNALFPYFGVRGSL